jgi:hypothetical protein
MRAALYGLLGLLFVAARAAAQDRDAGLPPAADATATADGGDDPNGIGVAGLLQVDGIAFDQASVDELDPGTRAPRNHEQFLIRRARVRLDGRYGYVRGSLQIDANTVQGPTIRLLAAELAVAYPANRKEPWVELCGGLFFIPFGFETTEPAASRIFLEASTWVNALFPGRRDLGARLSGAWSFLRYALAVMNGNPSASASLPLREPNRAKDLVGRLGAEGPLARWLSGSLGVSALVGHGFHPGAAPTKDQTVVRDVNEDGIVQPSEIQLVAGDPGEPSRSFDHNGLGVDAGVEFVLPRLGRGRLYGEWVWARNLDRALYVADPVAAGRSFRELGAMAGLRQYLTRHVEIGLRYDMYDPDRDASQRAGVRLVPGDARFSTLGAAVAWCSLAYLRLTLMYEHRENPLGRSASGTPTTLAADTLTLRGQLELR